MTALGVMVVGTLAFQLAPDKILGIFEPSPEFLAIGCKALRTISLSFVFAAFGVVLCAVFQALGNGLYATIVSLARQLFALLPVAYLLSLSGNLDLVWWSFPIAEVVSFATTVLLMARLYRKKIKPLYAETK